MASYIYSIISVWEGCDLSGHEAREERGSLFTLVVRSGRGRSIIAILYDCSSTAQGLSNTTKVQSWHGLLRFLCSSLFQAFTYCLQLGFKPKRCINIGMCINKDDLLLILGDQFLLCILQQCLEILNAFIACNQFTLCQSDFLFQRCILFHKLIRRAWINLHENGHVDIYLFLHIGELFKVAFQKGHFLLLRLVVAGT